jgi:type IV pilus assembly protein PilY1
MKARALASLLTLLIALTLPAGRAGGDANDLDLLSRTVTPNVLILVDDSGSMSDAPAGAGWGDPSKMTIAKNVVNALIDQFNPPGEPERVRFGLATFDSSGDGSGAVIEVPVGSGNTAAMHTAVNAMSAGGYTPLSEALVDVGRYFATGFAMGDYPSVSAFSSPLDADCRQSFVIVVTDGAAKHDEHTAADQAPFFTTIGNYDCDFSECSQDNLPDLLLNTSYTDVCECIDEPAKEIGSSGDGETGYLDDVAAYLYDTDLHGTFAGKQNVITYTVGFDIDHPLLSDAAIAGNGEYFVADDATELFESIQNALIDIIARTTSFTSVSVPANRSTFGDGLYTASLRPGRDFWEGHLQAYRLGPAGEVLDAGGNLAVDAATGEFFEPRNPFWDAADEIRTQASRSLYSTVGGDRVDFDTSSMETAAGGSFEDLAALLGFDPNDPTPAELSSYPNFPASGVDDLGDLVGALFDYLYGLDAFDQDDDGSNSDVRDEVLGDIFHSTPLLIGPPPAVLDDEDGFGSSSTADLPFMEEYENRDRVIYAGANDGMLHAFEAGVHRTGDDPNTTWVTETEYYDMGSGEERFGWIPGFLLDRIKFIPRNRPRTYFYVDGSPAAADVWVGDPNDPNDTTKEPNEWVTVLIVGAREGGRGYLALDVTNPAATTVSDPHGPYPRLLGELTDATATRLGSTWSKPVITRVKVRGAASSGDHCGPDDGDGDCRERWVAIIGGGYAPEGNPNHALFDRSSLPGKAIYMVAMDSGDILASVEYDNTGTNGPAEMEYAIPSDPAVLDLDFDGFADVVYVGDLGGQLWKWDISGVGENTVGDAQLDNYSVGRVFAAPVTTMGGGGKRYKSLFYPPSATFLRGQLVLAFGTGERADLKYPGDATKNENNRFYVLEDPHPTGALAFATTYDESDLTNITGADTDSDGTDSGFYFVVPDSEKFVTNHTIFGGFVITSAYVPDLTGADPCNNAGESFLYVFDIRSGLGHYFVASVTTGNEARRLSIGSGVSNDPQITMSASGTDLYVQTSTGRLAEETPPTPGTPGAQMIYWKQNF